MKMTFPCCLIVLTLATTIYAQNATRPECEVASVRGSKSGEPPDWLHAHAGRAASRHTAHQ